MAFGGNEKRLHLGDREGLKIAESDETISQEEAKWRREELARCRDDIAYFANKYFHVLSPTGEKVNIKLYPKQEELVRKVQDNNRVIVCASRQCGKTTGYVVLCEHAILFQKNYNILIAGNKGETARDNLAKIKDGYEELPNWMKPPISVWRESKIKFKNGVVLRASTTTGSTGRSGSIDMLILDEFAFVPKNVQEEFWKASLPTVSARPKAKIVIVSTPNGVGDKFHEVWQLATAGKSGDDGSIWVAHRIDWWERPDRDEAWYKRELASLGSKEAFDQEYGNSFTVTAGNKLIPDDRQLELKKAWMDMGVEKTIRRVEPANPNNHWTYSEFFAYRDGRTYVASADVAEGTGQDSSVLYVFDITEGHKICLCAAFSSPKASPSEFARVILHVLHRYGDPMLFIESNSVGGEVVEVLIHTGIVVFATKRREFYTNIAVYNRRLSEPGIQSNTNVKTKACLNLQRIVQNRSYELILPDEELFRELPFFEKQDGSYQTVYRAAKGRHDDHVMTLVWGLFPYSKEILEKYFIVEYHDDPETGERYPTLVAYNTDDIDEVRASLSLDGNADASDRDDMFALAAKWRELGDNARADYILQQMFDRDREEGVGAWSHNPFQIDPSKFSEGLFGERYAGMGRNAGGSSRMSEPSYGFGFFF